MRIWVDGSGWNGKESRLAVVFEKGEPILKTFHEKKTNNEMEYLALLEALKHAREGDEILMDSQLVVRQVKGEYKVKKKHLAPLAEECRKLVENKKIRLSWIGREENRAGHLLERETS